jgi:hypothetical protein
LVIALGKVYGNLEKSRSLRKVPGSSSVVALMVHSNAKACNIRIGEQEANMSDNSSIEWTDATWNPVRGCTKLSPGCKHCYAKTFAERFRGVPMGS